jgi:hypothetical protein
MFVKGIDENEFSQIGKNWGNNMGNRLLDHKYKIIFKFKRNWEKLINGWDVKIEKKVKEIFLREFIIGIEYCL